ncbi:MAG TPA: DJ-1/PfpI family protein [Acidimicrobiales bacterium]|nr:DJ-1/PfpI family protein [Acidimicrobiales bacterium]
MLIAFYLFDGMTALDAVGPYDVLNRIPGVEVQTVGDGAGPKRAEGGMHLVATIDIDQLQRPDVLVVPGGGRTIASQTKNARLLDWVHTVHGSAQWTVSVCTGALILGAAGLLKGRRATTHWRAREFLASYGAQYVDERVVEDGSVMTCGGVTAGIDMALALTGRLAGAAVAEAVQLSVHYDPHPFLPPLHYSDASGEVLAMINDQLGPR